MLRMELQAALRPATRGLAGTGRTQRPEWHCGACKMSNWTDRAHCRSCGKAKPGSRSEGAGPGSPASPASLEAARQAAREAARDVARELAREGVRGQTLASVASAGVEIGESGTADIAAAPEAGGAGLTQRERSLAPEARAEKATAQAEALAGSAATLRENGLNDRAAELEADATRLRKQAAATLPPPGRRLDELEAFCGRCRARTQKAAAAVRAAEAAFAEAREALEREAKEERDAAERLDQLRTELATTDAAMPDAHSTGGAAAEAATADRRAEHAEQQLQQARAHARNLQRDLDAAHLAVGHPPPEPAEALSREAEAELEAQLREAQRTLAAALADGTATAAQAGELAVLTARQDAARVKRGRFAPDDAGGEAWGAQHGCEA